MSKRLGAFSLSVKKTPLCYPPALSVVLLRDTASGWWWIESFGFTLSIPLTPWLNIVCVLVNLAWKPWTVNICWRSKCLKASRKSSSGIKSSEMFLLWRLRCAISSFLYVQFLVFIIPDQGRGIHFTPIGLWQAYTSGDDFGKCWNREGWKDFVLLQILWHTMKKCWSGLDGT